MLSKQSKKLLEIIQILGIIKVVFSGNSHLPLYVIRMANITHMVHIHTLLKVICMNFSDKRGSMAKKYPD